MARVLCLVLANQKYSLAAVARRPGPGKVDLSDDNKLQKSKCKAMAVTKARTRAGKEGREEVSKCKFQKRRQCNRQGGRS